MLEVAAAISMANAAFNGIKKAVEAGREIEDVAGYFGKFFDAKDQITEASQYSNNQPIVKKLFSGSSVEAQALEVTTAKYKAIQLEKELREFLIYSGQGAFYEDMMIERRRIRQARAAEAKRKAENKKFWIDVFTVGLLGVITVAVIVWFAVFLLNN
jgi:regulator of protease activity HflC (stomatin/prohibitin superfamily)